MLGQLFPFLLGFPVGTGSNKEARKGASFVCPGSIPDLEDKVLKT